MPLTVLAVADQKSEVLYDYFCADRWKHIDLILSCGDLSPDYLDFLCSSLDVPLFYVRGNHDAGYPASKYSGCLDTHGTIARCKGLRIAGFQGCRLYNGGPYQYSERAMRHIARLSRLRTLWCGIPDIVLTHAPPAGCHDGNDRCHQGFECFNALIDDWRPRYLFHGHSHAYDRCEKVTQREQTTIINAYPYIVVEIPEEPVSSVRCQADARLSGLIR